MRFKKVVDPQEPRYTSNAFLRLKLGRELSERKLSSTVFEDARAAHAWLARGKPSA